MKFGIIKPPAALQIAEFADLHAAMKAVGLPPSEVDHGAIGAWSGFRQRQHGDTIIIEVDDPMLPGGGVGYVVWEWSLFAKPNYWAVGFQLGNGPAVFYGVGQHGETVDLEERRVPPIRMLGTVAAVESEIAAGNVDRPVVRVNGAIYWQWDGNVTR